MSDTDTPPGFERLKIAAGFAADFGPIYGQARGRAGLVRVSRLLGSHQPPRRRAWRGARDLRRYAARGADADGAARAQTIADDQPYLWIISRRLAAATGSKARSFWSSAPAASPSRKRSDRQWRAGRPRQSDVLPFRGQAPRSTRRSSSRRRRLSPARRRRKVLQPLDRGPGFGAFFGPMGFRLDPPRLGFRVAGRHINLFGLCHGGALATFADYQIAPLRRARVVEGPFAADVEPQRRLPRPRAARRLDRSRDDASCARPGRYLFTQAVLSNANGPVARSTAIYAMAKAEV